MTTSELTDRLALADDLVLTRMGYGAMQLAGPHVMGPPRDRDEAIAVLREAVDRGVTHVDTADFYGPFVVNEILHEALHPYPADLRIVTKVGCRRGEDGSWNLDTSRDELIREVHENIGRLGVDALDVVNLRVSDDPDASLAEPFGVLAELQQEGLIRHLGVSNVSHAQFTEARAVAPVVCVQNLYNLVQRQDEDILTECAAAGIGFTSFFPLGGFSPLQSDTLAAVAGRVGATPQQTALAWLLQHSPAMLLIPGTSSRGHLRENLAAADLVLPADAVAELDAIS
ncbi:oxidoreductase [Actinomycetospora sp. NBRC 106375]|uniref:oxidoreductase n=1 Tax=Actinomycetospora sp. NBRC 106375 TaxID=3032207 RepID=UPI0024A528BD|nr:oxidoreductase [Actinomycetospora sp. NBRC 106375]GLZ47488.1 oxidoreductase [Actinomycetospora sp. NBRC 106375]